MVQQKETNKNPKRTQFPAKLPNESQSTVPFFFFFCFTLHFHKVQSFWNHLLTYIPYKLQVRFVLGWYSEYCHQVLGKNSDLVNQMLLKEKYKPVLLQAWFEPHQATAGFLVLPWRTQLIRAKIRKGSTPGYDHSSITSKKGAKEAMGSSSFCLSGLCSYATFSELLSQGPFRVGLLLLLG